MPSTSALARMQGALVVAAVLAATACLLLVWPRSPLLAVAAAMAVLFLYAAILALEFIFMCAASRDDPTPRASLAQVVAAWAREVLVDARVFGFRQPFAWRAEPDWQPAEAVGRTGVVFVHGFVCNRGFWAPWLRQARERGIPFAAVNLEPVFGDIDDFAGAIEEAVRCVTSATGRPPVLVCHSMGGLAARAWLRAHQGAARIAHVVTIASPHGGTWLARFSRMSPGVQMRQDAPWIAGLHCDEPTARLFTCWYSNCDNIVFPPRMATLQGADNRFVPAAAHVDLAFHPQVMAATFQAIEAL